MMKKSFRLLFKEKNYRYGKVEHHYFSIDVRTDVAYGGRELIENTQDIAFVDKTCEINAETLFGGSHHVQAVVVEIENEVLAQHAATVFEKTDEAFAFFGSKFVRPGL